MMNQEAEEFCMPVGFVFEPTDTELLSILEAKILEPTSYGFVPDCMGLYAEEPWRIFGEPADDNRRWKMNNHYYVFTKLKKSSKSKFGRRVGGHEGGTWKENNVKDVKNDRGVVVGTVRNFTFIPTKKGAAAAGRWIMDEFSIPEISKDYVVCKIKSITKGRGGNLIADAAPSGSSPQQYFQQVQYYDHMPDAYDDVNHMLSDTPHDPENIGGNCGHECSYSINHGDHMVSSIPSSSSSSSMLLTHPMTLCNGDDHDIDQLLSSFSTQYDLQQADQYDYIAYDVDHMLSDILLPPSTLPAATLFNNEQMIPSLPPQQAAQHDDHMPAYDDAHLFRDILVAEGDKVYDQHLTQEPLEWSTTPQQQAGAPSSSPLDELLLSFPSTQQVQHDHTEYDLDEVLFSDVPLAEDIRGHDQCQLLPLEPTFQPVPHDEKKSSGHWDLEAFSALVASQDVNPIIPSCTFNEIVSSPTSVHGVNFDDLWA